jgi:hypothetical protein
MHRVHVHYHFPDIGYRIHGGCSTMQQFGVRGIVRANIPRLYTLRYRLSALKATVTAAVSV